MSSWSWYTHTHTHKSTSSRVLLCIAVLTSIILNYNWQKNKWGTCLKKTRCHFKLELIRRTRYKQNVAKRWCTVITWPVNEHETGHAKHRNRNTFTVTILSSLNRGRELSCWQSVKHPITIKLSQWEHSVSMTTNVNIKLPDHLTDIGTYAYIPR